MVSRFHNSAIVIALVTAAVFFWASVLGPEAQTSQSGESHSPTPSASGNREMCSRSGLQSTTIHHYHKQKPTEPLPATLDPAQFANKKNAFVVYSIAAKIPELLYQLPCYCDCDNFAGHESLLDCFTSDHGATCGPCEREAIFAYEESRMGKSAAEIREGMKRGDVWKVDIKTYVAEHGAEFGVATP